MPQTEVAFVTGAGSGIGRATAVALAARGAAVGLFDLSASGLEQTAAEIGALGGRAVEVEGDVTSSEQVDEAVRETVRELGPLRTGVACAGIEAMGTVPEMSLDEWRRVIDVNLSGVFLTARHSIPRLEEAEGEASFVALSSDAGVQGAAGFGAYCASKHAVLGLVKSLALDHGPRGVRCNAVCPAFVETPMAERIFRDSTAEERARWERLVPLGRFARPEEVAAAIAHISSPAASYLNGHAYVLDGGSTAGYFEG